MKVMYVNDVIDFWKVFSYFVVTVFLGSTLHQNPKVNQLENICFLWFRFFFNLCNEFQTNYFRVFFFFLNLFLPMVCTKSEFSKVKYLTLIFKLVWFKS
jgi:hypothetical protein